MDAQLGSWRLSISYALCSRFFGKKTEGYPFIAVIYAWLRNMFHPESKSHFGIHNLEIKGLVSRLLQEFRQE